MPPPVHLIDFATPADMLEVLRQFAGEDADIVSVGPAPEGVEGLRVRREHRPLGSARLCGLRLRRVLRGEPVLHAWSVGTMAAAQVAGEGEACVVLSLPTAPPPGRLLSRLAYFTRTTSLRLTVPTETSRARLVAGGVNAAAVHVLPPPAEPIADAHALRRQMRQGLGVDDETRLIVAPTEMVRRAAHTVVSWAHAILRHAGYKAHLLFPGSGPCERHVRFFAATTGFGHEVFFTGRRFTMRQVLAGADIAAFFHTADCGVSALAAAMAAGLPVAASRTGDLAECAPDGGAAILCDPNDQRGAAAAMMRLLDDSDLADRLGQGAARIAAERFAPNVSRARAECAYARQEQAR